ncbi:MAG: type II toxin-antitoxin system VapC family toxin [Gemmatimonadetes bacterium]|nr:type II toxin-antitoxin system VapC family toxin [Gemmatimonadota bacterium]
MAVVDASVWVALLKVDESGHRRSRRWLEDAIARGETLAAPVIVLAEVGAALSRGLRDSRMAEDAVAVLSGTGIVSLHSVSRTLGGRAAAVAVQQRLRGCDAVYVALAEEFETELITLDKQQLDRGVAVVTTRRP